MKVECSCKRHLHGQLCDHIVAHLLRIGGKNLEEYVHERDTMQFYKKQYPTYGSAALSYKMPDYTDLREASNI